VTRPDADAERRDWLIEKLVPGGDGMAHLSDGRVAFVAGAFPGDVIRPLAVEARKGHVRATRFAIVQPSTERVTPPCPVAAECGGCDFMALERSRQLAHKELILRAALERTGGFDVGSLPLTVRAVGPDLGYRSRVRFHVDGAGNIGFFSRGSHALVVPASCPVCATELNDALVFLRRIPTDALAAFSEIDIRRADAVPRVGIRLVPRVPGGAGPSVRAVEKNLPEGWAVSVEGDVSAPAAAAAEQAFPLPEGTTLRAFPGVFTQVNWQVNVALIEAVVSGAREHEVKRFVDAYAGAGNFSLPLLAIGMTGVSIERDARAVECARASAASSGLPTDGFVVDSAENALASLARKKERFDLALLDPPRSGAREVLASVVKLAPPIIAVCSCDPVTLARDLATLARAGYSLLGVHGFDMFPHTHHLEALAWMSRPGATGRAAS
jgi:23S rRNA (uracil1939-C5)-methyltransferase